MYTKQVRDTVSSLEENSTADDDSSKIQLPCRDQEVITRNVIGLDIPGHFNFRVRIQETIETAEAVILVIDSKDRQKLPEAAEILYEILNNITVLDRQVPILVVCNKQDLQFAKHVTQVEAELEKDIEELRRVRRATMDDQDTDKQNISQQGFLEQYRKKFSFSDAELKRNLPPISFCRASVVKEELADVFKFIQANF